MSRLTVFVGIIAITVLHEIWGAIPSHSQVNDQDLQTFSETLLNKDVNNAAQYITINYQSKTRSRDNIDKAPQPLLTINRKALQIPTVAKVQKLYDNYIADVSVNEQVTSPEIQEENDLLDAFLKTSVMKYTNQFLIQKRLVASGQKAFRNLLHELWFTLYSRGNRKVGSSAFEHVFLGELKRGEVSGMHNWIYFSHEESLKHANYMGWIKKLDFGTKGSILKLQHRWEGVIKPVGSMFVGTSPELEMALYTVCFLTRPNERCRLSMANKVFHIKTFAFNYRGKSLIGSAFPEI